MRYDLIVRGGRVVRPDGVREADIGVTDGVIFAVEPELSSGGGAAAGSRGPEEVDARGLAVFPGVIDSHVHFNDPGRSAWEGSRTGSRALAAGGGTCYVDMPLNCFPPTLDGASFDAKREATGGASCTDFAFYGGLTPANLDRMEELAQRGVVGFKAFMCPSGIDDFPWADDDTLYRGMEIAAGLRLPVLLHAESEAITTALTGAARQRRGFDVEAFLSSRPIRAELEAINRVLLYARETGCAVHIVHVTTSRGVDLVKTARDAGVDATCETCPHYLYFTDDDMRTIGTAAKCAPPLRGDTTRREMVRRVASGDIDTVGSDHSPAPPALKEDPDFFRAWGGIAGVQTTLRVLLTVDVPEKQIARVTAAAPAARFRLAGKGALEIGCDADMTVVDTAASAVVRRDELLDRHRLSPYVGRSLRGSVVRTYLRGAPITDTTRGRLITPERNG